MALSALVEIVCSTQEVPPPPTFSYQAILSSRIEAESASRSPSPSTSATYTEWGTMALVEIVWSAQEVPPPPTFSYQAILSSLIEAESASRSPSPSTSAAYTERAPLALVEIVCSVQEVPPPPTFSYQAILSSCSDAESASRSPSPSTSATRTEKAPSALVEMVWSAQDVPPPPAFSYQAILSS